LLKLRFISGALTRPSIISQNQSDLSLPFGLLSGKAFIFQNQSALSLPAPLFTRRIFLPVLKGGNPIYQALSSGLLPSLAVIF
jgi:hypothetical protein